MLLKEKSKNPKNVLSFKHKSNLSSHANPPTITKFQRRRCARTAVGKEYTFVPFVINITHQNSFFFFYRQSVRLIPSTSFEKPFIFITWDRVFKLILNEVNCTPYHYI